MDVTVHAAIAPMPPPGAPCDARRSFGDSAIMTSVVSNRPATDAASVARP